MVKKADLPRHIVDCALALAAERPWREIAMVEIAEAAKLPLSQVLPHYPSKQSILAAFSRFIDAEVLSDASLAEDWAEPDASKTPKDEPDDESGAASARDRLFDVLMRRFDALQSYKIALGNLVFDQARDPCSALCALQGLRRSMATMLEAAHISSDGPAGALRTKGLCILYMAALRDWLRDDSPDMARTMATLDGHLRRVEALLRRLPSRP